MITKVFVVCLGHGTVHSVHWVALFVVVGVSCQLLDEVQSYSSDHPHTTMIFLFGSQNLSPAVWLCVSTAPSAHTLAFFLLLHSCLPNLTCYNLCRCTNMYVSGRWGVLLYISFLFCLQVNTVATTTIVCKSNQTMPVPRIIEDLLPTLASLVIMAALSYALEPLNGKRRYSTGDWRKSIAYWTCSKIFQVIKSILIIVFELSARSVGEEACIDFKAKLRTTSNHRFFFHGLSCERRSH